MPVLNDLEIIRRSLNGPPEGILPWGKPWKPMIDPIQTNSVREDPVTGRKIVSYGVSSYGYDIRVGYEFKVFTNLRSRLIDPKNFDEGCFEHIKAEPGVHEWVVIPPNSFALGVSVERFVIPRDIITVCLGKSTYARCGIIVNITPFEPEWEGYATIEISNTAPLPAVIYPGEGIAQVIFFKSGDVCQVSYADKGGKYQNQPNEIVLARV